MKGIIFNIQRFTIHDGPGIRTEIFFKGCPLSCPWCGNPEGQKRFPEPGLYPSRCIGRSSCGLCKTGCAGKCIVFGEGGPASIDRNACKGCMTCADECPADAIKAWGKEYSTEELLEIILRDREFYVPSGGGVTLSGGEVLLQKDFAGELLKKCRREGVHTCVETSLYAPWKAVEKILSDTCLFISDLKFMDSSLHKKYTGVPNEPVLDNLIRLVSCDKPLILRIPVIPAVNDTMENMEKSADFIRKELKKRIVQLQLLEYMHLGEEKYRSLGREYPMKDLTYDKDAFSQKVKSFVSFFKNAGIPCRYGTHGE